jgi:hypothetical protein
MGGMWLIGLAITSGFESGACTYRMVPVLAVSYPLKCVRQKIL